jgi:hypothetical protein
LKQAKKRPEVRIIASTSSELSEIMSSISFVEKPASSPVVLRETKSIATGPELAKQKPDNNTSTEEKEIHEESFFNLSSTSLEKSPR